MMSESEDLEDLLEAAKNVVLTPEEKEQQRPIRVLRFGQSPSTALGASARQGRLSHPITRKPRVLGTPVSAPASRTATLQSRIRASREKWWTAPPTKSAPQIS